MYIKKNSCHKMSKKLSIITINYNDKQGLQKTIESVINQTWKDFEFIVIDGNSTDGSVALIEQYSNEINYWVSEIDTGVYHAMNKGIKIANGEYLLFLNSGDFLVDNNILNQVVNKLDNNVSIFYGNLFYSELGKRIALWTPPNELSFSYLLNFSLPHPASFIKKELFFKYFLYNESLQIVSDWEFFIFCLCKMNEPYKHLDIVISDFDNGGISSKKENLEKIEKEKTKTLMNHFPLFKTDYLIINEYNSKRNKQFNLIKKSKLSWKILKGLLNFLMLFQKNKFSKADSFHTKII